MKKITQNILLILIGTFIGKISLANTSEVKNVFYSNYPIISNNQTYISKNPVLNYNGFTYLPLREISSLTNCNIDFENYTIYISYDQNNINNSETNSLNSEDKIIPNDKYDKITNPGKTIYTNNTNNADNTNKNTYTNEIEIKDKEDYQNQDNETMVYITTSGTKYHKSECRFLSKSKQAISLTEAISKGYSPCGTCNPS